jgi:glycosyltransferase involved in cell wall biosynthesis
MRQSFAWSRMSADASTCGERQEWEQSNGMGGTEQWNDSMNSSPGQFRNSAVSTPEPTGARCCALPSRGTSRVNVVIPCHNHAHYLGAAIESVLHQRYRDFEIIVADDGSTDSTREVVAGFGGAVRYLRQAHRGLSAARNAGILAATGEFVGFLDADDLWLPDFLDVLVPVLESDHCLGAVYCGSQFIDSRGARLSQTITRTFPATQFRSLLTAGEFFPPSAVVVRRSAFQDTGIFDESLSASEDWDMWLRIAARHPFAGVPRILALYRMHGDNMSRDLGRMLQCQLQVARKHFGPETGDPANWPVERQRAYAGIYLWHAIAHYQRNEPERGTEYVRRSFVTNPAIAHSLDAFYALVCAEQSLGSVGALDSLDLGRSATRVLAVLDAIFADASLSLRLRSTRDAAYSMANFALGILAYGQRHLGQARQYLVRAAFHRPAVVTNRQWLLTLAKALAGQRLLSTLRSWKRSRSL